MKTVREELSKKAAGALGGRRLRGRRRRSPLARRRRGRGGALGRGPEDLLKLAAARKRVREELEERKKEVEGLRKEGEGDDFGFARAENIGFARDATTTRTMSGEQ